MTTLGEKLREAIEKKQIQSTLNAWDAHEDQIRKPQTQEKQMANPAPIATRVEDKPHFAVTNNVMRETFNIVKLQPNQLPRDYINALMRRGFKESSVTSVIYQLIKAGQVKRAADGILSVAQDEYTPIKIAQKREPSKKAEPKKIVLIKRRKSDEGIAALTPDTGGPGLPNVEKFDMGKFTHHAPRAFHPSAIVDGLSVLHARELYDYLRKIFGGN